MNEDDGDDDEEDTEFLQLVQQESGAAVRAALRHKGINKATLEKSRQKRLAVTNSRTQLQTEEAREIMRMLMQFMQTHASMPAPTTFAATNSQ